MVRVALAVMTRFTDSVLFWGKGRNHRLVPAAGLCVLLCALGIGIQYTPWHNFAHDAYNHYCIRELYASIINQSSSTLCYVAVFIRSSVKNYLWSANDILRQFVRIILRKDEECGVIKRHTHISGVY